ncbi:MAG: HAD family phosphatase [Candidatus Saccharimonadales bacterium]
MKKFAVFDIDGTLIRWQLYHAIVDRLAKKELLGADAHHKLHQARMVWKQRQHPQAFRQYELAVINEFEAAFADLDTKEFDAVTKEILDEYGDQVYVFTRDLIKDLKDKGYLLLAISGSHQEIVKALAQKYGFDDWVGTNYQRANRRFSGHKIVASADKKAALQSLINQHDLSLKGSLAIGDSASDGAMLQMVEQPIAFNPDQKLYQMAKQAGWTIVIERKNVIYQLEAKDERYILA